MYYENSRLLIPSDDTIIWRYITFTKFCSMLKDQALYFCRLDKLHDKWEGVYPKAMLEFWAESIDHILTDDGRVYGLKELLVERVIPSHFVNCWFMSEYESEAMWRLYSQNYEGIAIKSTIGKLKSSFENTQERIWIGKVDYIDYDKWQPPKHDLNKPFLPVEPFFWKRLSFSHERELRALIDKGKQNLDGSHEVVNLNELIAAIYVFPDSKDWFFELVETMLKKHGYCDLEVKRSTLGERPWE